MKQVKIYKVADLIEKEYAEHNLTAYGTDATWAILEGPEGILVVDSEGCHCRYTSTEEKCTIDCCTNDGGMYIGPSCGVTVRVAEVMKDAETYMEPLGTFVRRFGSRLEVNYSLLLDSIDGIGLDAKNYPRNCQT